MNLRKLTQNLSNRSNAPSLIDCMIDRSVEQRCPICNHKFCVGVLGGGTAIETKCEKCGFIWKIAVGLEK